MRKYAYATGAGLRTTHWTQADAVTWGEFVDWMELDAPSGAKECGGYVAGLLQETVGHLGAPDCVGLHRNGDSVATRSIATLDVDHASQSFVVDAVVTLGCAMAAYTTWSHTEDAPRWRLLVPLSEDVKPEDYRLLVDALMHDLGVEMFDSGSRQPERLMHRPSTQGVHSAQVCAGEPLDVETWLARADELGLRAPAEKRRYTGTETYSTLTVDQQMAVDVLVQDRTEQWRKTWAAASEWPVGEADDRGRGWDALARDTAWACAKMAATSWIGMDDLGAEELYRSLVPEEVRNDIDDKWHAGLVCKAAAGAVDPPPWGDFDRWCEEAPNVLSGLNDYQPWDIASDLQLGKRVAREYLVGQYLAWGHTRWALWDGRRWDVNVADDVVNGDVREALLDIRKKEITRADRTRDKALRKASGNAEQEKAAMTAHSDRMRTVSRLSKVGILDAAKKLARPDLVVRLEDFDGMDTADLLNCGNGVVRLRTGELIKHDPAFKFTKITETEYVAGARHPDWDKCLRALPVDAVDWVQKRLGQGATGDAPTDEIVPFMRGGGENGKTTFLLGIKQALGEFYVTVPDKVLNGAPGDHTTEFMPLKGARLAVIEELPGGDWLDGKRIKKALGSETGMTARPISQDNVTWIPTHALIATTNHLIVVGDSDHGTRRRLCDLNFPHTFSGADRDPGIKNRMKVGAQGQHSAVLAWLVDGARAAYALPLEREHMPLSVRADTDAWLSQSNPVEEFLSECLQYDPLSSVLSSDVYQLYKQWVADTGRRPMSDKTFWDRSTAAAIFTLTDVGKVRTRTPGGLVGDRVPGAAQRIITCVSYTPEYRRKLVGV